jgi:uncharacterized protein YjbI with pentapeptide repeats
MKVTKPMKVPVICRPFEDALGETLLHVGAVIAFPLSAPRSLIDEVAFWAAVSAELGQTPFDEGLAKPSGELLVAGRCIAPNGVAISATHVRARVGGIDRRLSVIGDRYWRSGVPTLPTPFTELPIDWSRSFGGPGFAENPYGKGIAEAEFEGNPCVPLPNVEPYGVLLRSPTERPTPANFRPMDLTFTQRRAVAGTFGSDYAAGCAPRLPADHDPQFFNVAPVELRQESFWSGDEAFLVENMNAATPRQEGKLPGLIARAFVAQRRSGDEVFQELPLRCDTVWLFPSIDVGALIFRGRVQVAAGDASDIVHLLVACEELGQARSIEHYRTARARRLDKDMGALAELSDSDIMPSRGSGVAPNASFGELGQWVRSERISAANGERGRTRHFDEARRRIVEAGGDPSMLDNQIPTTPSVPEADDIDAVAAFLEEQAGKIEARRAEAEMLPDRIAEATREAAKSLERDPMADVAAGGDESGGPPRFRAADIRKELARSASEARAHGSPDIALEAQLADAQFQRQLDANERAILEAYRRGAHLTPPASPMTEEAAAMAKLVVGMARDAQESLAERDFTGADFRGLDLTGMDFSRAFLEGADLRGADVTGANFEGAVLAKADLRGAKLVGTRLRQANFGSANLEGATLDDADLTEAVLMRATTTEASFRGANFEGANMLEAHWKGVDLRGARFERCTFLKADLTGANLTDAHLVQTTFLECTLDDARFDRANLHKASVISCKGMRSSFVGADAHEAVFVHKSALPEANFDDANLERCCMRTTNLRGASFRRTRMTMSDVSECDATAAVFDQAVLKGALAIRTTFDGASLRGVNCNETLLSNARIAGADFTGAQLTRADFTGAVGDDKTRFTEAVVAWTRFDAKASKGASA